MDRNGYKGQLGFHGPSNGDELITNSTLPIQMHPGHGNSLQAPSALVTTPLIYVEHTNIIHDASSARTSETATNLRLPSIS